MLETVSGQLGEHLAAEVDGIVIVKRTMHRRSAPEISLLAQSPGGVSPETPLRQVIHQLVPAVHPDWALSDRTVLVAVGERGMGLITVADVVPQLIHPQSLTSLTAAEVMQFPVIPYHWQPGHTLAQVLSSTAIREAARFR